MKLFKTVIFLIALLFSVQVYALDYVASPSCADHASTTTGCTKALLNAIGTTKKATIVYNHSSAGTTTNYVIGQNADWSAYTNVTFKIVPGVMLQISSGKTVTLPKIDPTGLHQRFVLADATASVLLAPGSVTEAYPEWWGAKGDATADDTISFNQAFLAHVAVVLSNKTYLVNAIASGGYTNGLILSGQGPRSTILKPYDITKAAITYSYPTNWSYQSIISGIQFAGTGKVGVGFTFGRTNPADYVSPDDYYANVTFRNCRFQGLYKGLQFPAGNLGTSIYNCDFAGNYYGIYALNAKFPGGVMQSGIKYIYDSQFDSNNCAVYVNDTGQPAGGWTFTNTIWEVNNIGVYFYNTGSMWTPVVYKDCWWEFNGQQAAAGTTTLDQWAGTTLTTSAITNRSIILDGTSGQYLVQGGSFLDWAIVGTGIQVKANDVFKGGSIPDTVYDDSSSITINSPYTYGGTAPANREVITGKINTTYGTEITNAGGTAAFRYFFIEPRSSKLSTYGLSKVLSIPFVTPGAIMSGSFSLTGSGVADGLIYPTCNEFTRASFGSSEFVYPDTPSSTITLATGWYVFTMDVKVTQGNPQFYWFNGSDVIMSGPIVLPVLNKWFTVAGIGHRTGAASLRLIIYGDDGNCTWRLSAIQMLRFDTQDQASAYLANGSFVE